MRWRLHGLVAGLAWGGAVAATEPALPGPAMVREWRETRSEPWAAAGRALALVFFAPECPVCEHAVPELNALHDAFAGEALALVVVFPELQPAEVVRLAADRELRPPVLADPEGAIARLFGARRTPEAVVVAPTGAVVYRGRIDDRFAELGWRRPAAVRRELNEVLEVLAAGQEPTFRDVPGAGCPLSWIEP
jgi:thiol-disulfide isomerase/thioredoxin